MTAFVKEHFHFDGMYLTYGEHRWGGPNGEPRARFVARFKHRAAHLKGRAQFAAFLMKNFTVEEYFAALAAGDAPLNILEKKGYIPFKNTPNGLLAQAAYKRTFVAEARTS